MAKKKNPSPPSLSELFEGYQKGLIANLGISRKLITHPVAKGDATELRWIKMLRTYLPTRYQVERAFVIDSDGTLSQQQDLVIFDRHFSLFIFEHEGVAYIPAESVYAVFEIKPEITPKYLGYAGDKAESVRKLKRTSGRIVQAGGDINTPKPPPPILAGILALDCKWKDPMGLNFQQYLKSLTGDRALNLGCVARHGAFEITDGTPASFNWEVSRPDTAVMSFVLTLTRLLQRMGTVPAIKIEEYARHL